MSMLADFRSDTVTQPTPAMRRAMAEAPLGDDGYGDDPSVIRLQEMAAGLLGKEAALLVPSGSFGNQLALFTHCERGTEVLLDEGSHILQHEAGSPAVISSVQLRPVSTPEGMLRRIDLECRLRDPMDYHQPRTSLFCVENAHSNGLAFPLSAMDEVRALARERGLPVHLDGARIFNAAIALGCRPEELAEHADSVMFCLSKGLCAPVGSLLCGSAAFIESARRKRKIMGGQMRQAGVLAACGIVAFQEVLPRLAQDHERAKGLATLLAGLPDLELNPSRVMINMVFFRFRDERLNEEGPESRRFTEGLKAKGFLVNGPMGGSWRLVTHQQTGDDAVEGLATAIKGLLHPPRPGS